VPPCDPRDRHLGRGGRTIPPVVLTGRERTIVRVGSVSADSPDRRVSEGTRSARALALTLALAIACAVGVAACVAGTGTVATTVPARPAANGTSERSPAASPPGTTETTWGRIWDGLPSSFPNYPGAEPTQTGEGAASAVLDIPANAATAASWYEKTLKLAGYTTEALSGPLENGSLVIASVGAGSGCRVQTSLVPTGSQTIATILFAAACPFP
jgi:hypothetical protein